MKQTLKTLTLTAALSLAASLVSAATAYTEPVGAMSFTLRGNSDTYVALPFSKAADFQGTLSGAPTGAGAERTLSITGTPGFTADQFATNWYVKFTTGSLAGKYFTINSNTTSQVTIDINGDTTVGSAAAGNSFQIIKYWTLGELFPAGQTAITVSNDEFESNPASAVLVPNYLGSGVDQPAGAVYFPVTSYGGGGYGWADTADPFTPADGVRLPPDGHIVVRRSVAGDTTLVASGAVDSAPIVFSAFASNTQNEDNYIGLSRPKDVVITSLFASGFNDSTDSFNVDGDQLLYFNSDAASVGIDRPATQVFIRDVLGDWYDTTDPFTTVNTFEVPAGSGLVLRKKIAASSGTQFVTNNSNY